MKFQPIFRITISCITTLFLCVVVYPQNPLIAQSAPEKPTQTQESAAAEPDLQLIGTGEPKILNGLGGGRDHRLLLMMSRAKWLFYPGGKFEFVPGNTRLRKDLYPIIGTYEKVGDTYTFSAEKKADDGATASVNGTIRVTPKSALLEVTQSTTVPNINSRTANIRQTLSTAK